MNKLQQRMVEERLVALSDILREIGPHFDLTVPDSKDYMWRFRIEAQKGDMIDE